MNEELKIDMNDFLPLRDVVFNTLRKAILTGQLKPGERLMEVHLANSLGVSRTPIREAMRKLELEGLVIMIPRRGAEVARITEKSLKDVLEVRRTLDALSVELACERITQEEIEHLQQACHEFEVATKGKDASVMAKADVALHDIIVQATGVGKSKVPILYVKKLKYTKIALIVPTEELRDNNWSKEFNLWKAGNIYANVTRLCYASASKIKSFCPAGATISRSISLPSGVSHLFFISSHL